MGVNDKLAKADKAMVEMERARIGVTILLAAAIRKFGPITLTSQQMSGVSQHTAIVVETDETTRSVTLSIGPDPAVSPEMRQKMIDDVMKTFKAPQN